MTSNSFKLPLKSKILMAAPLVVIPFAALLFYSLGGGRGAASTENSEAARRGALSTTLPAPQLNEKQPDKLSLYQTDEKDSSDHRARQTVAMGLFDQADPSGTESTEADADQVDADGRVSSPFSAARSRDRERVASPRAAVKGAASARRTRSADPADELERKLAALQQSLEQDAQKAPPTPQNAAMHAEGDDQVMRQLEAAMAAIQQNGAPGQGDPELTMMNGMLDKVLDIQHPDRVKDRMDKMPKPQTGMRVAPVATQSLVDPLLGEPQRPALAVTTRPAAINGFYELNSSGQGADGGVSPSIMAVVHENQTLVTGATLKIRLEQDVYVQKERIPKGTFIYGTCSLSGERLQISFSAIRHGQMLFPVSLQAYGLDGILGVRIPGSMTRDAAKQGTSQAVQALTMSTMDPSVGAQATAAGIEAAKTLLTRKVRLVKVTIKGDYPLLLKDDSVK